MTEQQPHSQRCETCKHHRLPDIIKKARFNAAKEEREKVLKELLKWTEFECITQDTQIQKNCFRERYQWWLDSAF